MRPAIQRLIDRDSRRSGGRARTGTARNPAGPVPRVVDEAARPVADVLLSLNSSPDGISRLHEASRRVRYGFNEVAHEKTPAWYVRLLHAGRNPFILLLLALAAVSLVVEDYKAAGIITVMVTVSTLLRFVQEYRSNRAAEALQELVGTTATVSRPGPRVTATLPGAAEPTGRDAPRHPPTTEETPIKHLIPGDVVLLSAGDMIPADVVVLSAKDLFVSQSVLTGESLPVEKFAHGPGSARLRANASGTRPHALGLPNACFMGTNVVSGTARAVVVATGPATYLGRLANHVVGRRPPTAFDVGVNSVNWLLIRFMLVMVPLVLLINGFTKGSWVEAFFFALSVAVGLTPEMLPMIVTANLARRAVAMSRRKVIIKRLDSIQNLGAMDVLCTDKTGTLTRDRVVLLRHLDVNGDEDEGVFEYAFLNSYFQTGLKNLLDKAVLDHDDLVTSKGLTGCYLKCDEIPFDFDRRRMSVVVHEVFRGRDLLICKGAVEEVALACSRVRVRSEIVPLVDAVRDRVHDLRTAMNEEGLRVIAVAYKEVESLAGRRYGVQDEDDLVLCGFLAFLDPPKETTGPAIAALRGHGVAVKILTGDNELVAQKVCREVGLEAVETLLGPAVEAMDDDELADAAQRATLLAKLSPSQKARVHPGVAAPRAHGGFPRRRHQRRAGPARGRRRHLGRHRCRHRPRIGRRDPPREESVGAGGRGPRRAGDFREHPEVHQDGGQFELRQRVQRPGRERLATLPTNAAIAPADPEPPLRRLSGRDPVRQRRRGVSRAAAGVAGQRHRPVHALHRPDQLDLRSDHLRADVVRLRRGLARGAGPVSVGLVH